MLQWSVVAHKTLSGPVSVISYGTPGITTYTWAAIIHTSLSLALQQCSPIIESYLYTYEYQSGIASSRRSLSGAARILGLPNNNSALSI
jgi:hypothetical protein